VSNQESITAGAAVVESKTQAFVNAVTAQARKPRHKLSYADTREVLHDAEVGQGTNLPADAEDKVPPVGPTAQIPRESTIIPFDGHDRLFRHMDSQLAISPVDVTELSRSEQSLSGTQISPGLAMGTAWVARDILESSAQARHIGPEQIETEMERIRQAVLKVEAELEESARLISEQLDPRLGEIFHAHQMMLHSFLSSRQFETELHESLVAAPEAVRRVFRKWEAKFAALKSETFRVRADDILDLARQILRQLEGEEAFGLAAMPADSVLVTQRLLPSDVVSLSRRDVAAILVESLGHGSHAALLTREKSIPAVAEVPGLLTQIRRGDKLLVDAFRAIVVISPAEETQVAFERRLEAHHSSQSRCKGECRKPATTRDGQTISVEANLAAHDDTALVIENGADGIGLFRIEQLYLARQLPPTEEELYAELQALVSPFRDKPVTIRLLDIGGDKPLRSLNLPPETNPLLGRRGVRLLLAYPQLVRTQLKALLRLSQEQTIRILVPMVALERDIQKIRELFGIVAREMELQKLPPFGAMIETPAAALTVADIARHSDFLCVGTNDLTQYTFAAGRDDATVSEYYVDDHPALLRLLGIVVRESAGIPVTICGELGSREDIIPKLLWMGFRGLSIAPSLIPATKDLIRSISIGDSIKTSSETNADRGRGWKGSSAIFGATSEPKKGRNA
jgi:phosphoenolpyruvate-protein phosphotransferase (PTS system enzyme I)